MDQFSGIDYTHTVNTNNHITVRHRDSSCLLTATTDATHPVKTFG